MSIYIKNVDMPKGRPVCIVIDAAGQARRYDLNHDKYADDELFEAITVPPHGRLKDYDRIIKEYYEWFSKTESREYENMFYALRMAINGSPTIIPTEKGET